MILSKRFFIPYKNEDGKKVPFGVEENIDGVRRYLQEGVDGVLVAREYQGRIPRQPLNAGQPVIMPPGTKIKDLPWSAQPQIGIRAENAVYLALIEVGFENYRDATIQDVLNLFEKLNRDKKLIRKPRNFGQKSYEVLLKVFEDAGYVLPPAVLEKPRG